MLGYFLTNEPLCFQYSIFFLPKGRYIVRCGWFFFSPDAKDHAIDTFLGDILELHISYPPIGSSTFLLSPYSLLFFFVLRDFHYIHGYLIRLLSYWDPFDLLFHGFLK